MSIKVLLAICLCTVIGSADAAGVFVAGATRMQSKQPDEVLSASPQLAGPDGFLIFRKEIRNFRVTRGVFEYCLQYQESTITSPAKCNEFGDAQAYVSRFVPGVQAKYVGMSVDRFNSVFHLFYSASRDTQK